MGKMNETDRNKTAIMFIINIYMGSSNSIIVKTMRASQ